MGYDVHITRASHWTASGESPITLKEWYAYVEQDQEMQLEDVAIGSVKGRPAIAYKNAGLAVWTAYSRHSPSGNKAWFDYRNGRLVVKNPDEEILTKMKQIARAFAARVEGDDGESY